MLTAFISPFRADRQQVRAIFEKDEFIEVFVKCPIEECEKRDPKGLYEKARQGEIKLFTGIDSPYEEPEKAELTVKQTVIPLKSVRNKSFIIYKNVASYRG